MKPVFFLGAVTLWLGPGSTAFAQDSGTSRPALRAAATAPTTMAPVAAAPVENPGKLAADIMTYERNQNADGLLLAYGQAVTDATLARAVIAQLLSSYYSLRNQAQTAEQATQAVSEASLRFQVLQTAQNQVLIQQNQQLLSQNAQILALLQQNATRR